ncbi:MAG: hypothetical protein GY816_18690 [Cytophagales bacterium]|nr:hypothetical protein [Cytophagales bacterium]
MKILLLNLMMSVSIHANETNAVDDYTWVLDELNAEATEMVMTNFDESKVKIFDAAGNLMKEILKSDFDENSMNNSEYRLIAKSAFMFDYLGDSYFLLEDN